MLFLWEVESSPEGGRAHLFGSIHLGREDLRFDPAVEAAFASSQALVVELDLRALTPAESGALVLEHGMLPDDQSLDELVSEATWSEFAALLAEHGQNAEFYRGFEPWVAMVVASALLAAEQDLSEEGGVDRSFLERAGDREVIELETADFQLSLFDRLPLEHQVLLLEAVMTEADDSRDSIGQLYEAWRLGDAEFVAGIALDDDEDPALAALQKHMYADRNRSMAERIDALLRDGGEEGRYFVVVGAGHMVGDSGIPTLLRERGHRVRRIERSP